MVIKAGEQSQPLALEALKLLTLRSESVTGKAQTTFALCSHALSHSYLLLLPLPELQPCTKDIKNVICCVLLDPIFSQSDSNTAIWSNLVTPFIRRRAGEHFYCEDWAFCKAGSF